MIRLINLCSFRRSSILPVLIVSFAFSYQAKGQFFWHVDAANCPDQGVGSIVDPYCSIQTAIDASFDGDTIEVAPGTYFEAINFIGKAITLRSRDGAQATIIDATNVPDQGSGVSVVRCVSGETTATVMDGFTITGGTGDTVIFGFPIGGGMFNDSSSPTVANCTFSDNAASIGGGMYNNISSNPMLTSCVFNRNAARSGGGMYNERSNPTLTNCTFSWNDAFLFNGGGMYNRNSNPTIADCSFRGNMAVSSFTGSGGGIYNDHSSPVITDSTFTDNKAHVTGAGIFNTSSSPTVTRCMFSRNMADFGAGMYNIDSSSPTTINCTFTGNVADAGGGMYNTFSNPAVTNCIFNGNTAALAGGGLMNVSSNPIMTNCTFTENEAEEGGGMYNHTSSPAVTNCVLWGDSPDEVFNVNNSRPTIAYSDLQNGLAPGTVDGGGNIYVDPLFVDPLGPDGIAGTDDDDLRIIPDSPAMNSGNDVAVPIDVTTDLDGFPRINCVVDMGAYENRSLPPVHNVSNDIFFCTIQDCIDAATDSEECVVAPGTYLEAIDFLGKAITLRSSDGPMLTIIDATGLPDYGKGVSVVRCVSGEVETTVLDGFTITGGTGDTFSIGTPVGGGMFNDNSSPKVTNCRFNNNTAGHGGGMYNFNFAHPVLTNCIFSGNTANFDGGGMYNEGSNLELTNCMFIGNTADFGGGMFNNSSSPSLTNCKFGENTANITSGGMYNDSSDPTLTNCMFSGNTAIEYTGAIFNYDSSPTITNSTFSGNTSEFGGGITNIFYSSPTINNCILWNEGAEEIFNFDSSSLPTIAYSDIEGSGGSAAWIHSLGVDGGGNIDANPLFVDPVGLDGLAGTIDDDLRLILSSPAINAGSDAFVPVGINVDLDGFPRIVCRRVDMGVYENQSPLLPVHNISRNSFYCTIQECLDAAADFEECVVPPGTYLETINFLGKAVTLRSSGGPASTIINATGVPDYGNGVSVVRCISGETATTVLDGFTITGGMGDTTHNGLTEGGGMFNLCSSPTLTNCIFNSNTARSGGGIFNRRSSPTMTDCTFSDNVAGFGGAMYNHDSSSPTFNKCIFSSNTADNSGGAINNNNNCNPTFSNCNFIDNNANSGGGLYNYDDSSPTLTNCIFSGNVTINGGGMFSNSGSQVLTNCTFEGNTADYGAGMSNYFTFATITNCTFHNNIARIYGGGMYNIRNCPTVANCTFSDNSAIYGGGMHNDGTSPPVTDCKFIRNTASVRGGGMSNFGFANPTVDKCTFTENSARSGGGMANAQYSEPKVANCMFSDNTAGINSNGALIFGGGGMFNSYSYPTVTNCTFKRNKTEFSEGGGMYNIRSSPTITNCMFNGNMAGNSDGGGVFNIVSSPTLTNCTFYGNTAITGGGIRSINSSNPTMINCILWGDSPDEIVNFNNSTSTISYSDIDGSGGSSAWDTTLGTDGGGNIDTDPLFVEPLGIDGIAGTIDDDLRLLPNSPCIDTADYDAYLSVDGPMTDLDGKDRVIDNTNVMDTGVGALAYLDMGAYEEGLCHENGMFSLDNLTALGACVGGPSRVLDIGCVCVDLNDDEHVDLRDVAQFQLNFNP